MIISLDIILVISSETKKNSNIGNNNRYKKFNNCLNISSLQKNVKFQKVQLD
jgi:hypothetical protein